MEPFSLSMTRFTDISAYCDHSVGAFPKELSKISSTLAREIGLRFSDPLKMTESIFSLRISLAEDSPRTHFTDSMMLDFPHPLGPTMPTL